MAPNWIYEIPWRIQGWRSEEDMYMVPSRQVWNVAQRVLYTAFSMGDGDDV